jgi:hypothetical protein
MSPSNTHIHTYLRHACIHIHLSVCTRPLTLGVPHVGTHRNTYIITYRTTHGNTNTQTALNRPLTCEKLCFFKKKKAQRQASGCASGGWIGKHYQKCVHYSYILYTYLIHSTHRVCRVLFQTWVHECAYTEHTPNTMTFKNSNCLLQATHKSCPTHVSSSCHMYPPDACILLLSPVSS